jgi:hypothetical protein
VIHGSDNGDGTAVGQAGVIHVSEVPEPGSLMLIAGSAGVLFAFRRRWRWTRTPI